jgi:hypothetical protein
MNKIFISYRREDSEKQTDKIYQTLCSVFGNDNIFIDKEMTPLGQYFPEYLNNIMDSVNTILIVIGPKWDSVKDTQGRFRLESSNDYVRIEINRALFLNKHGIPVIPILLPGVSMRNLRVPVQIDVLKNLQAYELKSISALADLIQRLKKIDIINRDERFQTLSKIDQNLNPYQKIYQYGGYLKKLPEDAQIFLCETKIGWEFKIECLSNPTANRNLGTLNYGIFNNKSIHEAVAVILEWYDVSFNQIIVKKLKFNYVGITTLDWTTS